MLKHQYVYEVVWITMAHVRTPSCFTGLVHIWLNYDKDFFMLSLCISKCHSCSYYNYQSGMLGDLS